MSTPIFSSLLLLPEQWFIIKVILLKGGFYIMNTLFAETPKKLRTEKALRTIKEEYDNAVDHPEYRHFLKG